MGEPPLFISVFPELVSGFYKVAEIKTHFANLKLCGIKKKNWRRPEYKAGNRHEEISEVAYRHSSKRSFNYICISGFSRVV